jgi:hypothetical protein
MLNKKERMEKLNNAGINTGKYFTLDVNEEIPAGAKIHIVVDKDGNYVPEIVNGNNYPLAKEAMMKFKEDPFFNQIIDDGYVRNTKLHRRFVMAQMFHMLNYVSYDGKYKGYNDCLKRMYGYDYTLKMMTEEIRVLGKLETRDHESFAERSLFFNKGIVLAVMEDYLEKLKKYAETLPNRNCKGVPYKRIKGVNIFNADIDKKIYAPVRSSIFYIKYAKNYTEIYNVLASFMKNYIKLPYDTPKSKVWIDAYKGAGAFYTLKNLVMFHNCGIKVDKMDVRFGMAAVKELNERAMMYKGEGWRMFALMKKVIEDNGFDFNARMAEIYSK